MNDDYLSEKTAKQLKKWGGDMNEYTAFYKKDSWGNWKLRTHREMSCNLVEDIKTYSYYDIIVTHAKEFFDDYPTSYKTIKEQCFMIMKYLIDDKKEEAEEYLLEHCKFNPKNK